MESSLHTKARRAGARTRTSRAEKVSISLQSDDLAWLRARAKRNGGNLSAELAEATRVLRQSEARRSLLALLGDAAEMTAEEADALRREWDGAPARRARRR